MANNAVTGLLGFTGSDTAGSPFNFALTEEDKRRQMQMALMNAGVAMAGAGGDWRNIVGRGLLAGVQGYEQGYGLPAQRFKQYGEVLDTQNKALTGQKTSLEIAKMSRDANEYQNQQTFYDSIANPTTAALYAGGGPSVRNLTRANSFEANPAAVFSDPTIILRGMKTGIDPKQFATAAEATRPYKMEAGGTYVNPLTNRREYVPKLPEGMQINEDGVVEAIPGYARSTFAVKNAEAWAGVGPAKAISQANADYQNQEYIGPDGKRYVGRRGEVFKQNPAGVRVGESALGGKLAELDAGYVNQLRDKHDSAVQGNYLLTQLENKISDDPGVYGGMMAKGMQGVSGFFNGLGVPFDAKRFGNSQEFTKYADQLGMSLIKQYVGSANISDADREAVMSLMPRITDDPAARQRLMRTLRNINDRSIGQYLDTRQKADRNGTLSGDAANMYKPLSPSQMTSANLEFTARKYGVSIDEIRRRLGL